MRFLKSLRRKQLVALVAAAALLPAAGGCAAKINLFPDPSEPLREFRLQGRGREKILVIPVRGTIADRPQKGLFHPGPSLVQEVVARLKKAEKDSAVKAVVLKIDSPGGTATASDMLYHEISSFKERTGTAVVAAMMNMATSGAYYISLPADSIFAHPTTVTGSTGAIFLRPKVEGLLDKIGVDMEVNKAGRLKDMGSPFRVTTDEEERILQGLIDEIAGRFMGLVEKHRSPGAEALPGIATARVYLAPEALEAGLIDEIGYLQDAVTKAGSLAGLGDEPSVVVYRRSAWGDDNLYWCYPGFIIAAARPL